MAHEPSVHRAIDTICTALLVRLKRLATLRAWLAAACMLSAAFFGTAKAQHAQEANAVVLIAHSTVTAQQINRDTIRAMFAMRQRTWPSGQSVAIFVLPNRDPVHARFTKEKLSVYPHQLQLAWDRMVFSGMGQAPNRVQSQLEMREQVANTPGALGYLEREHLDESVHVISME